MPTYEQCYEMMEIAKDYEDESISSEHAIDISKAFHVHKLIKDVMAFLLTNLTLGDDVERVGDFVVNTFIVKFPMSASLQYKYTDVLDLYDTLGVLLDAVGDEAYIKMYNLHPKFRSFYTRHFDKFNVSEVVISYMKLME